MDFLERLSAVVCGKQYLFKQDDGMYYSKYHGCELEVEEAQEWLLDNVRGNNTIEFKVSDKQKQVYKYLKDSKF